MYFSILYLYIIIPDEKFTNFNLKHPNMVYIILWTYYELHDLNLKPYQSIAYKLLDSPTNNKHTSL